MTKSAAWPNSGIELRLIVYDPTMPPSVPVNKPITPMMAAWARIVLRTWRRVMATTRKQGQFAGLFQHVHGKRIGHAQCAHDKPKAHQAPQAADHAVEFGVEFFPQGGE